DVARLLRANLPQRALQQQVTTVGRSVQERLRRYLTQRILHRFQLIQFTPAVRALRHVGVDRPDLVRVEYAQGVRAQQVTLAFGAHRTASAVLPASTPRIARKA